MSIIQGIHIAIFYLNQTSIAIDARVINYSHVNWDVVYSYSNCQRRYDMGE